MEKPSPESSREGFARAALLKFCRHGIRPCMIPGIGYGARLGTAPMWLYPEPETVEIFIRP